MVDVLSCVLVCMQQQVTALHHQAWGQWGRRVCFEHSSGRPCKHTWQSVGTCTVLLLGETRIFGNSNLPFPSRYHVWCVSCEPERAHHMQAHCMYVCVCKYEFLLHTPQHLAFFVERVVSIFLHEDICPKLHLLDDLHLGIQISHHPSLLRQMHPCSQSCQE